MMDSGLQPYLNNSVFTQIDPVAIHIDVHISDIGHTSVACPVLIGCFHVEIGQRAVALTQLGEGVGAGTHKVMTLLVKCVIVRIPIYTANCFWKREKGICSH